MLLPLLFVALSSLQARASSEPEDSFLLESSASPAESVSLSVPLAGAEAHLELERYSLRARAAFVRTVGAGGMSLDMPAPDPTTYRGFVRGDPGSTVLAARLSEGWSAWIELGSGEQFELEPVGGGSRATSDGPRIRHRLAPTLAPGGVPGTFACGAPDDAAPPAASFEAFTNQTPAARCLARAQIAFDADFEYFQAKGSSVASVVAAIDALMNQVDFFYARDVQITFDLSAYVVRTAPFYAPTGGGNLLDLFRSEWNTNQAAVPRDLAHLMTGKPGSLIEFGGLAFVGTVCTSSQYGWSMDGANIVGHEVGHNFGAGHCHDVAPCNNMCGACFYVGPNTRRIITAFRDSRACLDAVGDRPPRVPPYAMPDHASGRKDALAGVLLEVLANDDDGDCQPLMLASFERTSERGGSIRPAPRSLGDWSEQLLYTRPAAPFVGTDRFGYQVGDGRLTSTGEVTLESRPLELLGYWPLDDLLGTSASDHARGGRNGTLAGNPVWDVGRFGGALYFDGTNDRVSLPALDARTDQLTLSCWVRRQGTQDNFAGLVFSRAGSTVAGLSVTSSGALRYTWNDEPATYNFGTGITLPNDQWVFVALVVEPRRATVYFRNNTLVSSVNPIRHAPEEFDGVTLIGRDSAGLRDFRGWIDDVRVYGYALTPGEVARLAAGSGPADAPLPRDGARVADAAGALAWEPGVDAVTHDLYLGTSHAAVRDATPAAPEFRGTLATTSFAPGTLARGTMHYWRVDEHAPGGLEVGPVWQFEPAEFHRWPLDESSGSTAQDVGGALAGTYLNGVLLAQPGATPSLGLSASFDGTNDRVSIPALDLDSNRVTLTCWLKRNGGQNAWAGLLFSRAGSTVAGLHFGTAQELRYTWNDDGGTWGWDSGLVVPDGQWVLAALVVEPSRATLYLGQGGVLSAAVNPIAHAAEAFDGALWLGRDPHSSPRHYRGGLDDVRVYDHALTQAEVEELYFGSL